MRIIGAAFALFLTLAGASSAQGKIFKDYDELRSLVDERMKAVEIVAVFSEVLPRGAAPMDQIENTEKVFKNVFPDGLTDGATILRKGGENGYEREILAYWRDNFYVFARIDYHAREDGVVVFAFNVNGALSGLMKDF